MAYHPPKRPKNLPHPEPPSSPEKAAPTPATNAPLRVHVINDGGGVYWHVAASPEEAMSYHVDTMYTQAVVPLSDGDPEYAGCLPDDKPLTVLDRTDGPPTRTAKEWAETGAGFLATTEF